MCAEWSLKIMCLKSGHNGKLQRNEKQRGNKKIWSMSISLKARGKSKWTLKSIHSDLHIFLRPM